MPALEVTGQNMPWTVLLRQPIVIIERLVAGLFEVEPRRFLFDDQRGRPEEIDETLLVTR